MGKLIILFLILTSTYYAVNLEQINYLLAKETIQLSKTPSIESDSHNVSDEDDDFVNRLSLKKYNFSVEIRRSKSLNGNIIEDNYAVVSQNGKQIIAFNDFPQSGLAEYRFKQMPNTQVIGKTQAIVETTMPKEWIYRIINLSPKFEIVFDSRKYNLGHSLKVLDIDQDGVNEISMDLMTFDYFGVNYRKGYVTPQIVFKYDKNLNEYVFANKEFKGHLLNGIDSKIGKIDKINSERRTDSEYDRKIYSAVMDVFLTYIYIGEETKAWKIFEKYNSSDKIEVKTEIKKYLARDFIYNLIQKKVKNKPASKMNQ